MPEVRDSALLERDEQLAELRGALASAAGGSGRTVFVDGAAGAGKTSLLSAAREAAGAPGLRTLAARGAELEQAFAFGVVRQLLDDVVRRGGEALFEGPARFAAALLGLEGAEAPTDDFTARHAIYWLVANLAEDGPLALFVDDAHWADTASLSALAHLANRLEDLPVALVVASRTEEADPALDALRAVAGTWLEVPPLGTDAAATLVRSFDADADDRRCAALFHATGGNPFLLSEIVRGGADDWSPDRVTREINRRLARLTPACRQLGRAAAVLGDVPLRQAAKLAGLEAPDASAAADALVAAGILAAVNPLRFLHPLVRTAVYAGIGPARLGDEHRRAARLLADEGAPPEQVAAQLLRSPPAGDPWVHEQLTAAADTVGARGAFEAQATYLRRALAEPPSSERRTANLLALAEAEAGSADVTAAVEHLREALRTDLEPLDHHASSLMLANLLAQTGREEEAMDVMEEDVTRLDGDPAVRATAEAALLDVALAAASTRQRATTRFNDLRRRAEAGETMHPALMGAVAMDMTLTGDHAAQAAEWALRALPLLTGRGHSAGDWAGMYAAGALIRCGHLDVALEALDRGMTVAQQRGAGLDRAANLSFRAELNWHRGDLDGTELDARAVLEVAQESTLMLIGLYAAGFLGHALVERGDLEAAEAVLHHGRHGREADEVPPSLMTAWVHCARADLHLAHGRPSDAVAAARAAEDAALAHGAVNPSVAAWRSVLTEALLAAGEPEAARVTADEGLARARRFGAPRAIGMGLIAVALARPAQELPLLEEAVAVLDGSGAQLELARAHIRLGGALRRADRLPAAREWLRTGIDRAHRLGARRLEDEGLDELRATGARPRRRASTGWDALTPSERRIAELAAAGRQNRDIADELFVTVSTVEFHLRNAYRKLGVSRREELVAG